jgi:hypothetical protein
VLFLPILLMSHPLTGTFLKKVFRGQAWWYIPVIPASGRLKQEDCEFEASQEYMGRPWLNPHTHPNQTNKSHTIFRNCSVLCHLFWPASPGSEHWTHTKQVLRVWKLVSGISNRTYHFWGIVLGEPFDWNSKYSSPIDKSFHYKICH